MKRLIAVVALLSLTVGLAQADSVLSFTDDFTGVDGTSIIGPTWGYVDLGVELSDWASHPRTAPADRFEIQNNELYANVTPLETTDPAEYNKVMASIYPMGGGSQVSLTMGAGEEVVYEVDLVDTLANAGHRWNLNQEVKLVLTDSPNTFVDPNSSFDNYMFKLTVRPEGNANEFTCTGTANSGGAGSSTASVDVAAPAAYPQKLRMVLDAGGNADFYLDGTPMGSVTGTAMATVYPYVWVGKFNGGATVLTEGDLTLDNYVVEVVPEPATLSVLGLVGLAALIRRR
jgi:PEP-CTERM motif-containing protein